MAPCELIESCIFFNDQMTNMPSTSAVYKKIYCEQAAETCARFQLYKALGREQVPRDLFPNQGDRAKTIIATRG